METRSKEEQTLRRRSRDAVRTWVDQQPKGFQARLAERLGLSPSQVSKALGEGRDMGSPQFVKHLAREFPEWRPLLEEYRALEDGSSVDPEVAMTAERRAEKLRQIDEFEKQAKAAISQIADGMREGFSE